MSELFADTGYWIALLDERDSLHGKARELGARLARETIVTTEMVWTELLNHASNGGERKRTLTARAVMEWTSEPGITVIPQTTVQFQQALDRYLNRQDQSWSIVDCASFIVMEARQIQDALAFDRHFEQAGFTALLREGQ